MTDTKTDTTERLLTDVELAAALGLGRAMVHKMRNQGMPTHQFGRARRYRVSEVVAWADNRAEELS